MGFSLAFPGNFLPPSGFRPAHRVEQYLNRWPNGLELEALMSWMNDCAKYHRWEDSFGKNYSVNPDGFNFLINGQEIQPNVTKDNIEEYYEKFSQLHGKSWTYEEFWYMMYSYLAYMYNQIAGPRSEGRFFNLTKDSYNWPAYEKYLKDRIEDFKETPNSGITLENLIDNVNFGDPYIRTGGIFSNDNYFTPSGLSRFNKIKKDIYDPMRNHQGFAPIDWNYKSHITSLYYNKSATGNLFDTNYVRGWMGTFCFYDPGPAIYCGDYGFHHYYFNPSKIYEELPSFKRTFPNDKEKFIEDFLQSHPGSNNSLIFSENLSVHRVKTQTCSYSAGFNFGSMGEESFPISYTDGTIGGDGWRVFAWPYSQWVLLLEQQTEEGTIFVKGPRWIEEAAIQPKGHTEPFYAQILPTLPMYNQSKYGVANANYYPQLNNSKFCPATNAYFSSSARLYNKAFSVSVYIGSGSFYNKYGIPGKDNFVKGIFEVVYNRDINLHISYGLSNNADVEDIWSGKTISYINDLGEKELNLEEAFTTKGYDDNLYLWIAFKDASSLPPEEEKEKFNSFVRENINSFISDEVTFNPFDPSLDYSSIYGYTMNDLYAYDQRPDHMGEIYKVIPYRSLKATRSQTFEFDPMTGYLGQKTPTAIYAKVLMPGDLDLRVESDGTENPIFEYELMYGLSPDVVYTLNPDTYSISKFKQYGETTDKDLVDGYPFDNYHKFMRFKSQTKEEEENALMIGGTYTDPFEEGYSEVINFVKIPLSRKYNFGSGPDHNGFFPFF